MQNIYITDSDNKKAKANKLVQLYAGAPTALKTALKKEGLSYVKVERGVKVFYTVRNIKTRQQVIKITL